MEEACLERIGAVIADSGSGGMLRVRHQDLKRLDRIPAVLTSLATSQEHVDLLIDHRSANMTTLSDDLESVPDLMAWRTLIAASGTFPRSYPINKGVNGSI
jgi:hypothetical protein